MTLFLSAEIMERYSIIHQKRPREIVLLRGRGCVYKKCAFCDYYTDSSPDAQENYRINKAALEKLTGRYGEAEILNSGSVFELDEKTIALIKKICKEKKIGIIHFESHYLFKDRIPSLREEFYPIKLKLKLGLESFDYAFREQVLHKGIEERNPEKIAENFDEANLLFGITGQTEDSMRKDIALGLNHFERICINLMCENSTGIKPDKAVKACFLEHIYPQYKEVDRVDILINNTDFGVGD